MTETPKTFKEALYALTTYRSEDGEIISEFEQLWNAGHAAGRLEGLEGAAKIADKRVVMQPQCSFGAALALLVALPDAIRARAKDAP